MIRHGVIAGQPRRQAQDRCCRPWRSGLLILPTRLLEGGWAVVGDVLWWAGVRRWPPPSSVTVVTGVDYVVKALALRRGSETGAPTA